MNIDTKKISVLTPERIKEISSGEVTSPHIFDDLIGGYDEDGLFSKKIFGIINDYTCKCSDKSRPNKEGRICSQCGTVYKKAERRNNNFGHIDFVVPLLHPIFKTEVKSLLIIPPAYRPADLDVTTQYIIPEDITKLKEYDVKERIKPGYGDVVLFITSTLKEKAFDDVFCPIKSSEGGLPDVEQEEMSEEVFKKFKKMVHYYKNKLSAEPNSNNPIYAKLKTSNQLKAKKGNKQKVKADYVINFNKTDINYVYSKIIDYNNSIKTFIEYKSRGNIYDLFKYCYDNYQINKNGKDDNSITDDNEDSDSTKERVLAEKNINLLVRYRKMRRDEKFEIIKENFKPIYIYFNNNGRFTGEQYDKFRSVYRYVFKKFIEKDTIIASEEDLTSILDEQIKKHTEWMQYAFNALIHKKKISKNTIQDFTKKKKQSENSLDQKEQESSTDEEESLTVEDLSLEEEDRASNEDETVDIIAIDEYKDETQDEEQDETTEYKVDENETSKNNIDQEEPEGDSGSQKQNSGNINTIKDNNFNIKVKPLISRLTGKYGHFRDAALGKRVDYSGRSVIVVEPNMNIDEIGLPYEMAIKLFEPNIIKEIIDLEKFKSTTEVKLTKKYLGSKNGTIELYFKNSLRLNKLFKGKYIVEIWECLEKIMKDKVVLLVRNPSLHRMNVQAFKPKLISNKAIKFHPLVLKQFGADIDGDTMSVFVPLSVDSKNEAKSLLMSGKYLFSPANGEPVTAPSQDMLLGLYYLTKQIDDDYETSPTFSSITKAIMFYNVHHFRNNRSENNNEHTQRYKSELHNNIILRHNGEIIKTTVGRAIFNSILPKGYRYINVLLKKKGVNELIKEIYDYTKDVKLSNKFIEDLKDLGLNYATTSGLSIGLDTVCDDFVSNETINEIEERKDVYFESSKDPYSPYVLLGEDKEYFKNITSKVKNNVFNKLESMNYGLHPLQIMLDSGARGTEAQIMQILGVKGYLQVSKCKTDKREFNPHYYITSNFNKGYKQVFDYIVSAKMARKLAYSESVNVPMTGYLERKLIYFADDIVIKEINDCGTNEGLNVNLFANNNKLSDSELTDKLYGRILNENISIKYPDADNKINTLELKKGEIVDYKNLKLILCSDTEKINVRSSLKCQSKNGCCAICYGMDLARAKPVKLGTPIGVIAAQSLGEPSTQLQLKNFHTGGVFQGGRIEDSFKIISSILHGSKDVGNYLAIEFPENFSVEEAIEYQREKMVETIYKTFKSCGASINTKHIELFIKQIVISNKKKMTTSKSISEISKGMAPLINGEASKLFVLNEDENKNAEYNSEMLQREKFYYEYKGITDLSNVSNCALKKLSYQNIPRYAKNIVDNNEYDDFSSMASRKIKGEVINAGTGIVGDAYFKGFHPIPCVKNTQNRLTSLKTMK